MSLFPPPRDIEATVFATLPDRFRRKAVPASRAASGRSVPSEGCFLEGPSFDREGNLYVTDIPFGRVFRVAPDGAWTLVTEYEGEPNGLKIHADGRVFVTDYRNGVVLLDPASGRVAPLLEGHKAERFKGVNDLFFARNGDLYFTDQGQTGLQDPTGRVYRLRAADNRLERLADNLPSPNGLVLDGAETTLYVAVTRANAVWRLPLAPDGSVLRMGVFVQLSGGRGPDGLAMDEADGLAVAHPDMGAAWVFDRRGEPRFRVRSPRSDVVTNLAFGGPENRTLHIVDSVAGCILTAELPTPGRRLFSHA